MIAKAFKEVGLLTTDQGSYKFMPSDFSKEGGDKLKLTSDACLGEELMIVFDEEELKVKKAELLKEEEEARKQKLEEEAGGK